MKTKIYIIAAIILLAGWLTPEKVDATVHLVSVANFSFAPSSLSVTVGDTIKWVWVSGSHTTTSTNIPAGAATWDQPISSTNLSYSYKVTIAGTYNYKCTPHAAMGMVASFSASNPANTLSVLPAVQNVPQNSGITSFSVVSNSSWTASSDQTWCTVTPSGNGNGTIIATYQANTTKNQRSAMITITVAGLAAQTVMVDQSSALGINDPGATTFSLYPNPVISVLNISSESLKTKGEEISIYTINSLKVMGPIHISGSPVSVDLSMLPDGVYFIRTTGSDNNTVQKIIKTH